MKYKSSIDAFKQIIAKEGTKSLFKRASANILQVVVGARVLSKYDNFNYSCLERLMQAGVVKVDSSY